MLSFWPDICFVTYIILMGQPTQFWCDHLNACKKTNIISMNRKKFTMRTESFTFIIR